MNVLGALREGREGRARGQRGSTAEQVERTSQKGQTRKEIPRFAPFDNSRRLGQM